MMPPGPPGPPWERPDEWRYQRPPSNWSRLIEALGSLAGERESVIEERTIEIRVPAFSEFTAEERAWCGRLIEAGYRALARKNHPDRGGSTEKMQVLNAVVAKLRTALEIEE